MAMTTAQILFAVLVVLSLADAVVTVRTLRAGGMELNPVLSASVKQFGTVAGVVVPKAVILMLIWIWLPKVPEFVLGLLVAWYLYWAARGFHAAAANTGERTTS